MLFCADGMCGAEVSGEADRVGDRDEAVGKDSVAMYTQPPRLSARFDPVRLLPEHEASSGWWLSRDIRSALCAR